MRAGLGLATKILPVLVFAQRAAPADIWLVAKHPKQHRQRSRGGLRASAQEAAAECRRAWVRQVHGTESVYYHAIGTAEALMEGSTIKRHGLLRLTHATHSERFPRSPFLGVDITTPCGVLSRKSSSLRSGADHCLQIRGRAANCSLHRKQCRTIQPFLASRWSDRRW